MGDDKDGKGGKKKPKPPELPKDAPADVKDFIDCKGNAIELKPGKVTWLGLPGGEFLPDPEVSFKAGAQAGTVDITVTIGTSMTIPASVKDGKLDLDTSNVPVGADGVQSWVKKLNDWFEANGKKLGPVTLKDGKVSIAKEAIAAGPAKGGVKGGLFPHVPMPIKVGGALVFVGATIFGVAERHAGDTTETRIEHVAPAPAKTGGAVTQPNAVAPLVIHEGCIWFTDYAGYGVVSVGFTLPPGHDGPWTATFGQGPTGAVSGSGTVTNQRGRIDVRVSQLGNYGDLYMGDVQRQPLGLGPLAQKLPFHATSAGSSCNLSLLQLPTKSASKVPPTEQPVATTRTVTVRKKAPPFSLVVIPGTAAALAGLGMIEEDRRRRCYERRLLDDAEPDSDAVDRTNRWTVPPEA